MERRPTSQTEQQGETCWNCERPGRSIQTDDQGRVTDVSCNTTTSCRR